MFTMPVSLENCKIPTYSSAAICRAAAKILGITGDLEFDLDAQREAEDRMILLGWTPVTDFFEADPVGSPQSCHVEVSFTRHGDGETFVSAVFGDAEYSGFVLSLAIVQTLAPQLDRLYNADGGPRVLASLSGEVRSIWTVTTCIDDRVVEAILVVDERDNYQALDLFSLLSDTDDAPPVTRMAA